WLQPFLPSLSQDIRIIHHPHKPLAKNFEPVRGNSGGDQTTAGPNRRELEAPLPDLLYPRWSCVCPSTPRPSEHRLVSHHDFAPLEPTRGRIPFWPSCGPAHCQNKPEQFRPNSASPLFRWRD